jgi:hypothetical protein
VHRIVTQYEHKAKIMAASQQWDSFFSNWPASLPRSGVLLTNLNETMPFKDFWLKDGMLLVERTTPDAMGARFVLLSFEMLNVLKFTNPFSAAEIAEAGFRAEIQQRQPQLA